MEDTCERYSLPLMSDPFIGVILQVLHSFIFFTDLGKCNYRAKMKTIDYLMYSIKQES